MNYLWKKIAIWWQAFRFHFVPPSFLPAILGGVVAWAITGEFHPWYFLLTVIGVTINHIGLNMTDDYFDYRHSIDRAKEREKNPYSGGSGTLTSGLIEPKNMAVAFRLCYIITIIIGLYLSLMTGWQVLIFGVFGLSSAYFYTAPPIRYGYHGFGEISQLINFSLTIGLGAYFVQVQTLSWETVWVLLPLGFMMFAMITINEIPDEEDDRLGKKRTLVVIFGAKAGVWLYGAAMIAAFAIIVLAPLFNGASFWVFLSLITFPWFLKAFRILVENYQDPEKMAPANMMTIRIHNITGILLTLAYIIQGISNGFEVWKMIVPVVILIVLYSPVALTIFLNMIPVKTGEKAMDVA
ncbi:1,4-dihydroxy-2-naphthoate octaprenyltransferase [candidate division KSB1 bacterium]|nr:1,4-dihydroxy-2-naphthoate octaprenyltransferase [candidate division KSB1 bacterium]